MVIINGKEENAAGMTILAYLEWAGFDPKRVVVERNLEIIPQERLDSVKLETGDQVEILHFVGGG
ncbi:MAG: sulfur carrier protein ThiS [Eubacterium sp.]|nr:sulfur carrier protein ThiS [Eubacterium sp.]